jgi:hypothetical protein
LAERKFIFLHADGYHEEQASTDSISLGGLTMGGNIAMGSHKITGLLAGTDATDAVNKAQLDGMAVGLSWKDPVKVLRILSDADQSTVVPTAGSTGEAWVVNNWTGFNDGDIVEWDGDSWDVVVANSGGFPVDGTRVIVIEASAAGSFAGHEEDIATYVAYTDTWDFVNAEDGDASLVIGDGSVYENQGYTFDGANWVQFTGTGLINAGDGLGKTGNTLYVNVGDGLEIAADAVAVDLAASNPGLEFSSGDLKAKVDTSYGLSIGASGIAVDIIAAGAGTGGLEFSSGDLQVKTDGAHGIILTSTGIEAEVNTSYGLSIGASGIAIDVVAAGGLEFSSGDLQIKIDDTPDTLDVDADGLKVVGLPSLFKVNDTAVGATVTAANFDILTNGSDASSLHKHNRSQAAFVAGEAIAAGDPVYVTAANNTIAKADAGTDAKRWVIGLAPAGILSAATGDVVFSGGIVTGVLTGATAGTRYWLADGGGLTATRPTGGKNVILAGVAKNATDLVVEVRDYGKGS